MSESTHPEEGDFLNLTGIVHNRCIMGLDLPNGYKYGNGDGRFDEYTVYVEEIETHSIGSGDEITFETITLRKPCGDTTTVKYRGREPIAGTPGQSLRQQNSQGAEQYWTWEKVE